MKHLHLSAITLVALASLVLTGSAATASPQDGRPGEAVDAGLKLRLERLAEAFARGSSAGELGEEYLVVASQALGDEPRPLDANAKLKDGRVVVHRIEEGRVGEQPIVVVIGQIASPEYGCLVWRRAAITAARLGGQWHTSGVLAQLQVTHTPRPPCIDTGD
jgi:hypothetical protein